MQKERYTRPVVLVAEPQALPGMWLEDVLTDAGCAVSGPYGTCAEASETLDEALPDYAVISTDPNRGPASRSPVRCAARASPSRRSRATRACRAPSRTCRRSTARSMRGTSSPP